MRHNEQAGHALPVLAAYLVRHYHYDDLIEVVTLSADNLPQSSRFLAPSYLAEEQTLNPVCFAALQSQASTGEPPVFY